MAVNTERLRILTGALRSGKYRKGTGSLHNVQSGTDAWCCLGVASDQAAEHGCAVTREIRRNLELFFDGAHSFLPVSVMQWYGFEDLDPQLLSADGSTARASDWNDNGMPHSDGTYTPCTFDDIADAFERTYLRQEEAR